MSEDEVRQITGDIIDSAMKIHPKKSSWSLIRAAQPCGSGSE